MVEISVLLTLGMEVDNVLTKVKEFKYKGAEITREPTKVAVGTIIALKKF